MRKSQGDLKQRTTRRHRKRGENTLEQWLRQACQKYFEELDSDTKEVGLEIEGPSAGEGLGATSTQNSRRVYQAKW